MDYENELLALIIVGVIALLCYLCSRYCGDDRYVEPGEFHRPRQGRVPAERVGSGEVNRSRQGRVPAEPVGSGEVNRPMQGRVPVGEDKISIPLDSEISNLSPPSYVDRAGVQSEDVVPSYEEVMSNSASYIIANSGNLSATVIENTNNVDSIAYE